MREDRMTLTNVQWKTNMYYELNGKDAIYQSVISNNRLLQLWRNG